MQLDIYTHYFKVTEFNAVEHSAIMKFCLHLSHSEMVQDEFGNKKEQLAETYAARTRDLTEYRFIISCLDIFLRFCDIARGIPIKSFKTIDHRSDKPFGLPVKLVADPSFMPRDYQPPLINFAARLPVEGRESAPTYKRVLEVQAGKGKAVALTTPIKVPGGWKLMRDIKVGDVVSSVDGGTTIVDGVYPQGNLKGYKITFWDGRETIACAEHLWRVYSKQKGHWITQDTLWIMEALRAGQELYIPLPKSELVDHNERYKQLFKLVSTGLTSTSVLKFETKEEAEKIQYLIRSLGGTAELSKRLGMYCINFGFDFGNLRIRSVVPDDVVEMQCISVTHHSALYIINDFIVTHNTKMALQAITRISQRVVAILKPMYMDKWVNDIKENFSGFKESIFNKKDICTVSGNKQLINLIAAAKGDYLEAKFIIISNRTLQIFIEEYEAGLDVTERYGCKPDELFEVLKAGVKLGDEVHEYFHFNFKMDLYTHNVQSIELSATLEPGNRFMKDMYKLMFPAECRISMAFHKYVEAISLNYRLAEPKKVRCTMRGMYNHGQFEKSLLRQKRNKRNYYEMIKEVIDWTFINGYGEGDRLLVFFYLVDTCKEFSELLKEIYPDLKIFTYVGGSKEEELRKNDIIVSTLKSCGTARDIPDLTRVINTIATDTPQGNLQYMGRLRELKHRPDVIPRYYYLTAENNDKHVKYRNNKQKLFDGKVTKHLQINLNAVI